MFSFVLLLLLTATFALAWWRERERCASTVGRHERSRKCPRNRDGEQELAIVVQCQCREPQRHQINRSKGDRRGNEMESRTRAPRHEIDHRERKRQQHAAIPHLASATKHESRRREQ